GGGRGDDGGGAHAGSGALRDGEPVGGASKEARADQGARADQRARAGGGCRARRGARGRRPRGAEERPVSDVGPSLPSPDPAEHAPAAAQPPLALEPVRPAPPATALAVGFAMARARILRRPTALSAV